MGVDRRGFGQALLGLLAGGLAGGRATGQPGPSPRVQTPDVPKLPWRLDGGVKVFNLVAEPVRREFLPGRAFDLWGINGSVPGPTIEVDQGDRVRIHFTNRLPEGITVHWHGLEVPVPMDGVPFISQPLVMPGESFTYEYTLHQAGTFFYHSHMPMQEMMGLLGFFIIHPREPFDPPVQHDYCLALQEFAVLPNNTVPNTMAMEFNWLTINGRAGPHSTPLIVKQGDRVRLRLINMGMDHHPMHLHGHQFTVTGTEGGRIPPTAWHPVNTVLVGVAQARDLEFEARFVGDWMFHCHLPHHMMNGMASLVGPLPTEQQGAAGGSMEEGMGMPRQGHALSDAHGPAMGRDTGLSGDHQPASPAVGQPGASHHSQGHQGHDSDHDTQGSHGSHGLLGDPHHGYTVPGFPQDMLMIMDEAVAKPETEGLAPGWSASVMGMMTLVRVMEPARYDAFMARLRSTSGRQDSPAPGQPPPHQH